MGFRALVLLGDWDYYSKRGFVPGEQFDIHMDGWYLDALQVRELHPGELTGISGQYFDAMLPLLDDEAQAAFDATFPPRGLPTEEDKARHAADAAKYETACRPAPPGGDAGRRDAHVVTHCDRAGPRSARVGSVGSGDHQQ